MLDKINLPIVVNGGLDTKSDTKLVDAGSSLVQSNADFDDIGAVKKREGTTKFTDDLAITGTLSSLVPTNLIEHNNELLVLTDSDNIASYRGDNDEWEIKNGDKLSMFTFIEDKYGERVNTFSPSIAECPAQNFRVIGYVTNNESLVTKTTRAVVIVQDYFTNNKKIVWDITQIAGSANDDLITHLQVQVFNKVNPVIFITYHQWNSTATKWEVKTKTIEKDGTAINDISITTGSTDKLYFDTIITSAGLIVASGTNDTEKTVVAIVNTSGVVTTATLYNAHIGASTFDRPSDYNCYSIVECGSNIFIAYIIDAAAWGGIYSGCLFGLNKTTLLETFPVVPISTAGGISGKITLASIENDTKILSVVSIMNAMDILSSPAAFVNDYIESRIRTIATNIEIGGGYENASLVSKATVIDGNAYFVAQSVFMLDSRYALIKVDGNNNYNFVNVGTFAISKASLDVLNSVTAYQERAFNLPSIIKGYNDNYYFPGLAIVRSIPLFEAGNTNSFLNVSNVILYRFEFDSEYKGINAKLGGNTYIAGSTTREYDGNELYSQSFLDVPEVFAKEDVAGGLAAGTYGYCAIFEFVDANGQVHRSKPSNEIFVSNPGGKEFTVSYTISDNYLIQAKEYSVIIYRTVKNGTVFYRLGGTSRDTFLYGVPNPFTDQTTDATLISNEQLYTTGGILENSLLPPCKYLLTANNRIFALMSEDENEVLFSQPYLYGECVNFSQFLSFRIDMGLLNRPGKGMALGSLDGKIIIFKDQSIAYIYGDGPNQLGEQNSFSEPKLISSDVGLTDIKSIASIPDGLIFKSQKGLYLLDRSLQLTYIGASVEAYNNETIVGVSSIIDEHKVLFMTANRTLMYDYLIKKWATWDWSGIALITSNGLPAFIKSNRIYNQSRGIYKDDGNYYSLRLVTPWLKVSGIQNFQRIWDVSILGTYYSAHTLTLRTYVDYDDSTYEEHIITPLNTDIIYQYYVKLNQQKCQAVKLELYDTVTTGLGQAFKLSNVSLSIGQKKGLRKIPDARKYV